MWAVNPQIPLQGGQHRRKSMSVSHPNPSTGVMVLLEDVVERAFSARRVTGRSLLPRTTPRRNLPTTPPACVAC